MRLLRSGSASGYTVLWRRYSPRFTTLGPISLLCLLLLASASLPAVHAADRAKSDPRKAHTSRAARDSAVRAIPFEKLHPQARAKVAMVLSKVSVFRRMPVRVVECDPDLYLFLLRHPDVIVNIWEVLKVGNLTLRQIAANKYQVAEATGTTGTMEYLYGSHDTHVVYTEGTYEGPLFARPVLGRGLLVVKTGYVREPDGRYYITTRLDAFVRIDHGGAELLTKAIHPLVGRTVDTNFVQTVAFVGSLSRTAEVNSPSVQRLAARLLHVQPQLRLRLAELAAAIPQKYAGAPRRQVPIPARVASRKRPPPAP